MSEDKKYKYSFVVRDGTKIKLRKMERKLITEESGDSPPPLVALEESGDSPPIVVEESGDSPINNMGLHGIAS